MAVDDTKHTPAGKALQEKKPLPDDREPTAPDGGWGWMILLASFLTSVIVDGVCFAFGIFYLEFLRYFKENKGKTAWIGSVLNGTYMVMGPLVGALANRFGCRAVAITGSLWSAVAFFLSTFSPNVDVLIFTYGVLGGMGFGLMYLPSIVIVGFYFDKKRAFATGIATCGSGIGAFIFAPLCKFLIDQYGWRGAQWIVAAIVLNGIVLGALYRPLTFKDMEKMRRKLRRKQLQKTSNIIPQDDSTSDTEETEETQETDTTCRVDVELMRTSSPLLSNGKAAEHKMVSTLREGVVPRENGHNGVVHFERRNTPVRRRTISNRSEDSIDRKVPHLGDSWHSLSGYAVSMENMAGGLPNRGASSANQKTKDSSLSSTLKDIMNSVMKTMDFTMLMNPVFVLYGISCILCMAGFFIPFIYLPDNAIGLGYSSAQGALLLSILGITNTLGRVVAGWASDQPWADPLLINNIALIVGGVSTFLCPFCTGYAALIVYACVFGLCIAAFVSLRSIILVELIGLNKLTSAFGIIVLCQGLTSFVGAPIAGSLYDMTGTYNLSFYVAGTTIALAGIISLPLRRIARWQATSGWNIQFRRKTKDSKDHKAKSKPCRNEEKASAKENMTSV